MCSEEVVLTPLQEEGVLWMVGRETAEGGPIPGVRGGVLADAMGLGKTHTVAALMARRRMPTLVIATIPTLQHWFDTLRRHDLHPCCVLSRDHAKTLGGGVVKHSLTVVTVVTALLTARTASAARCCMPAAIDEMFSRPWGRVVLDEAHVIRNPATQVHKTLSRLNAAHRWAVTGTPIQNRERDLQALAAWLGAGPSLPAAAVVQHLVLRRALQDCPPTADDATVGPQPPPPLVRHDVVLDFHDGSDEARIYAALCPHLRGTGPDLSAVSDQGWGALLRCRQAASHPRMLVAASAAAARLLAGASATEVRHLPAVDRTLAAMDAAGVLDIARLDPSFGTKARWVVRDLVEAAEADPETRSIVFCDWLDQMQDLQDALVDECPGARTWRYHGGISPAARSRSIQEFSSRRCAGAAGPVVMFIQVQCGAVGINLQAANRVYILGPQWNPTVELQAVARAHRLGQTRAVHALHVTVRGTVDEHVQGVQGRKLSDIAVVLGGLALDESDETHA